MEWGSLPAGKQVSLEKNAGRGQGKRAAQPFHLATEVSAIPRRPEMRMVGGWVPSPITPPSWVLNNLIQLICVAFKLYSVNI